MQGKCMEPIKTVSYTHLDVYKRQIGFGINASRVLKGKKMPGRMGQDTVALKNKKVIEVKDTLILISGPIPGAKGDLVAIYGE